MSSAADDRWWLADGWAPQGSFLLPNFLSAQKFHDFENRKALSSGLQFF
jgi:hypothetical protein